MKAAYHPVPELDSSIAAYADAVKRGDLSAAEAMMTGDAMENHRAAIKASGAQPFEDSEILARARIGFEYITKIRWRRAGIQMLLQNRWAERDGKWTILDVDDLTRKRSPWSDEPAYRESAAGGNGRRA